MRLPDFLSLIFENLSRRKGRVALTAVGVVIGTAAVVLLVSLASGLQQNAASTMGSVDELTQIFVYPNFGGGGGGPGIVISAGGGDKVSKEKQLTTNAVEEISALPGVQTVIERDSLRSGARIVFGDLENYSGLQGIDPKDLLSLNPTLQEGSLELGRGSVVIGGWAAHNFVNSRQRPGQEAPPQPKLLGQSIKVIISKQSSDGAEVRKTVTLRVVGILKETRGSTDGILFVNMDELNSWNEWVEGKRINRRRTGYEQLIVKADSTDAVIDLSEQINKLGYMAHTPQSYVQGMNSVFMVMQLVFGGVGAIALLVAAIGIANTMTMSILERTREIGLMKAIGATNRDVLTIFLGEAAGIGFLGGLGGVTIGWGSGQLLNTVLVTYLSQQAAESGGLPATVAVYTPLWLPVFALVFATLVGLISGLYPALRAATLVPITALKYE